MPVRGFKFEYYPDTNQGTRVCGHLYETNMNLTKLCNNIFHDKTQTKWHNLDKDVNSPQAYPPYLCAERRKST